MEFNSTTMKGRANVSMVTLGSLATLALYYKFKGGSKVSAKEVRKRSSSTMVQYSTNFN